MQRAALLMKIEYEMNVFYIFRVVESVDVCLPFLPLKSCDICILSIGMFVCECFVGKETKCTRIKFHISNIKEFTRFATNIILLYVSASNDDPYMKLRCKNQSLISSFSECKRRKVVDQPREKNDLNMIRLKMLFKEHFI